MNWLKLHWPSKPCIHPHTHQTQLQNWPLILWCVLIVVYYYFKRQQTCFSFESHNFTCNTSIFFIECLSKMYTEWMSLLLRSPYITPLIPPLKGKTKYWDYAYPPLTLIYSYYTWTNLMIFVIFIVYNCKICNNDLIDQIVSRIFKNLPDLHIDHRKTQDLLQITETSRMTTLNVGHFVGLTNQTGAFNDCT